MPYFTSNAQSNVDEDIINVDEDITMHIVLREYFI